MFSSNSPNLKALNQSLKMANDSRTDNPGTSETFNIINCVLNAPLMFITIIGNTLVLAAISGTPSLRSPSIILLCSLSFSDLLVGLVVQPLYIAHEISRSIPLQQSMETVAFSACGVSLSTITAISVDRYLALHYHMRYPHIMTTIRARNISGILWFICVLLSFSTFWKRSVFHFTIVSTIIVCITLCTVYYIRIYRIVRQHQLQIHAQQQAVEASNSGNELNVVRSSKSAKNTFIYYTVMLLCYTPLFISMSISAISRQHWKDEFSLAETIAFMNSSINPFLYCWRLRELRTAVANTAKRILLNQTEEN